MPLSPPLSPPLSSPLSPPLSPGPPLFLRLSSLPRPSPPSAMTLRVSSVHGSSTSLRSSRRLSSRGTGQRPLSTLLSPFTLYKKKRKMCKKNGFRNLKETDATNSWRLWYLVVSSTIQYNTTSRCYYIGYM